MSESGRADRSPLDGIFFDIDDTLYSTTAFAQEARHNSLVAMQQAGLDADLEFLKNELTEVLSESPANFGNHYDQLLNRLPRRLYRGRNPAVIVAAGVVAYHETKARGLEAYEDVIEVLAKLAATDVVLGVITSIETAVPKVRPFVFIQRAKLSLIVLAMRSR